MNYSFEPLLSSFIIFFQLALVATASTPFYLGNDRITTLTNANWTDKVVKGKNLVLVEYYSPRCGHCVNLKDTYIKVANKLSPHVTVGAINCELESICGSHGINGYPTIKLFFRKKDGRQASLNYSGERSVDAIVNYVQNFVDSAVLRVSEKGTLAKRLDDFLEIDPEKIHILMVKEEWKPSIALHTLSTELSDKVLVGALGKKSDPEIFTKLGLSDPGKASLIVFDEKKEAKIYEGLLNHAQLTKYLVSIYSERLQKQDL